VPPEDAIALAVFADGHVAGLKESISPTQMRTYVTANGGDLTPTD
jgi:hypothetical protein